MRKNDLYNNNYSFCLYLIDRYTRVLYNVYTAAKVNASFRFQTAFFYGIKAEIPTFCALNRAETPLFAPFRTKMNNYI